jgi:hypothetical protein
MTRHPVVRPPPARVRRRAPGEPGGQRRPGQQLAGFAAPPIWAAVSGHERWAGGRVGLQLADTSAATSTFGTAGSDIDLTL